MDCEKMQMIFLLQEKPEFLHNSNFSTKVHTHRRWKNYTCTVDLATLELEIQLENEKDRFQNQTEVHSGVATILFISAFSAMLLPQNHYFCQFCMIVLQ